MEPFPRRGCNFSSWLFFAYRLIIQIYTFGGNFSDFRPKRQLFARTHPYSDPQGTEVAPKWHPCRFHLAPTLLPNNACAAFTWHPRCFQTTPTPLSPGVHTALKRRRNFSCGAATKKPRLIGLTQRSTPKSHNPRR